MHPSLSINNCLNALEADSKLFGQNFCSTASNTVLVKSAYLKNLFVRQFGCWRIFTTWLNCAHQGAVLLASRLSALGYFVAHVVSIGSKPQMERGNTFSVVTKMKALKPFRNWSYAKLIDKSIGPLALEASVSVRKQCSHPVPTRSAVSNVIGSRNSLINASPECFDGIHNKENTHRTQREGPHSDAAPNPMGENFVSLFCSPFKAFQKSIINNVSEATQIAAASV